MHVESHHSSGSKCQQVDYTYVRTKALTLHVYLR